MTERPSRLELESEHLNAGATFANVNHWLLPLRFAEPKSEYAAAKETAALMDASFLTIVSATGKDHLDYLNRRLSQKVTDMPVCNVRRATLLGGDGKTQADLQVLRVSEGETLLVAPPGIPGASLEAVLSKYVFHEAAKFQNETGNRAVFCTFGPQRDTVGAALGFAVEPVSPLVLVADGDAVSFQCDYFPGAVTTILPRDKGPSRYQAALDTVLRNHGLRLGFQAFDMLRVEGGVPWFGTDLDEDTIPVEADLLSAIHRNKGCYPGQEVIARILNLGHPARKLVGVSFNFAEVPGCGDLVTPQGESAGRLTSCRFSPMLGRAAGLAMVKWPHRLAGTVLVLAKEEKSCVVNDLPFSR